MKKILFIASEPAPGMVPFAVTIINALSNVPDYEIHCICVNSGKLGYKGKISENAHPIFVESFNNCILKAIGKIWPYKVIAKIKQTKREVRPDIIHFLTGDFTLAFYIRLRADKSFYYTVHDLHPHETYGEGLKNRLIHQLIVKGYKRCRDVVANLTTSSVEQLVEMQSIYPKKRICFTSFPSLVTDDIKKGKASVIELFENTDYILFFGSVDKYKGVELLKKAFCSMENLKSTKLVIAGRSNLEYDANNENVIRINRFIGDAELKDLFSKALFVVYPYTSATMSGVLSLAFYFKKRMLLSDIPFFKQYATSETFFFKAGDLDDLKEKLEMMLRLPTDVSEYDSYALFYSDEALMDSYKSLYNC